MAEHQITCVTQDNNGVITFVGIGGAKYSVQTVVNWLRNKTYAFYTYKKGYKAYVYPKQSLLGNWFLTTEPDSTMSNNLDFLPSCF